MTPLMFKGLKALIVNMAVTEYPADTIFQAFLNGLKLPANNNFVIITELDTRSMAMMPAWEYDAALEVENVDQLDSTWFQVDFYGNPSRNAAAQFRLTLQSYIGSDFLDVYGCNVHEVGDLLNLTGVLDRENYTKRFAVKFSLFNNNTITQSSLGFDDDTVDLRLAEVQI